MTEFRLLKDGKKVGFIDVTNKGFTVIDDLELAERFGNSGFAFVRTESIKEGAKVNVFFRARIPTDSMMRMLIHLEPNLSSIGYEVAILSMTRGNNSAS